MSTCLVLVDWGSPHEPRSKHSVEAGYLNEGGGLLANQLSELSHLRLVECRVY